MWTYVSLLLDRHLEVEFLGYVITLYFIFTKVAMSFYIPTSTVGGFLFIWVPADIVTVFFIIAVSVCINRYLTEVLLCSPLMTAN